MDVLEPVVWTKAKYLEPKTRGRYKGGTNSSSTKRLKRTANRSVAPIPDIVERVMVLDFRDGKGGKINWITRPKEKKK